MNNNILLQLLFAFSADTRLNFDSRSATVYGCYNGFEVSVAQVGNTSTFQISASVKRGDSAPDSNELKAFAKQNKKYINSVSAAVYKVRFNVTAATIKGAVKNKLRPALEIVTSGLNQMGYENCCQHCGTAEKVGTYYIRNDSARLCESCYRDYSVENDNMKLAEEQKSENIIGGIVGALLGSLIGGVAIVLIGQLGYVAAISGIIMGVCALKGYEMLGGKLTKLGMVISSVIMLAVVLLSHHIDWSIAFMKEFNSIGYDISIFDSFKLIIELLKTGELALSDYLPNLILVLAFTALGAVPTFINSVKAKKSLNVCYRLDSDEAAAEEPAPAAAEKI